MIARLTARSGGASANSSPLRLMLIDDSAEARAADKSLVQCSLTLAGEARLGAEAATRARELKPDVLLVALEEPLSRGLRTIETLAAAQLEPIVAMSSLADPETMRRAMLAGARDYLVRPFDSAALEQALAKAWQQHRKRQAAWNDEAEGARRGEIITVFGAKGGIGRTTLAINLAVSLAHDSSQKVALVDLDLQLGDVALMLDLKAERNIADLEPNREKLDPELVCGYLTQHDSGLSVLPASPRPEDGEKTHAEDVSRILTMLAQGFDFVVVDTPRQLNDTVIAALDASTLVCLLSSSELACLKSTRICLDMMRSWGYSNEKVKLVVNQAHKGLALPADDAQATLDYPIFWKMPYDGELTAASHWGRPIMQDKPKSKISRNISGLAGALSGAETQARSFLPWRR